MSGTKRFDGSLTWLGSFAKSLNCTGIFPFEEDSRQETKDGDRKSTSHGNILRSTSEGCMYYPLCINSVLIPFVLQRAAQEAFGGGEGTKSALDDDEDDDVLF